MTVLMQINVALALVQAALALWVGLIYWRNHRTVPSPFTLALGLFALFLVVHNGLVVYHYLSMMATFTPLAEQLMLGEGLLGVASLGFLLYATTR